MQQKNVTTSAGTTGIEEPFFEAIQELSSTFMPRTKDIVWSRFGLSGKKPKTLEAIGKEYGITRERVRQIVMSAISSVRARRDEERFLSVADRVESAVNGRGGIVSVDDLYDILASGSKREAGALSFFLQCLRSVKVMKETADRRNAFVTERFSEAEWIGIHEAAKSVLSDSGHIMKERELYRAAERNGVPVGRKPFFDALSVSARIRKNPFEYWGFADSDDISPRGTREKARLVLKMNGKPMHFKAIAAAIDEAGLQKRGRKTHPQTVHNELIKDRHFVLVGRGLYALSDWGYEKGTVRQVIARILREAERPLSRDEVIDAVSRVRTVKRSTIVINLNTFFEKVGKGRYTVKKGS